MGAAQRSIPPAVVGQERAAELLLTGALIGGDEAHRLAAEIASCAPLATKSIRATLRFEGR